MVTKKYKISLQSLARYAELYLGMTVLQFIDLILKQEETLMLSKIIVTFLIAIMGVVDGVGTMFNINVCPVIDNLNEVAYKVEEVL